MSAPKILEVLVGFQGDVIVSTEADGATHSWTVRDSEIFGGGIISPEGVQIENHNAYRRNVDKWVTTSTSEKGSPEVDDEIAAHFDLAEQVAAIHKTQGLVQ